MSLSPSLVDLNDIRAAAVAIFNASGVQLSGFDPSRGSLASGTQIPYSATSQIALAANPNRRKARFYNGSNKTIYITLGSTCTPTNFTDQIPQNTSWETDLNEYTGDIAVLWVSAPSAGQKLNATEIT